MSSHKRAEFKKNKWKLFVTCVSSSQNELCTEGIITLRVYGFFSLFIFAWLNLSFSYFWPTEQSFGHFTSYVIQNYLGLTRPTVKNSIFKGLLVQLIGWLVSMNIQLAFSTHSLVIFGSYYNLFCRLFHSYGSSLVQSSLVPIIDLGMMIMIYSVHYFII